MISVTTRKLVPEEFEIALDLARPPQECWLVFVDSVVVCVVCSERAARGLVKYLRDEQRWKAYVKEEKLQYGAIRNAILVARCISTEVKEFIEENWGSKISLESGLRSGKS